MSYGSTQEHLLAELERIDAILETCEAVGGEASTSTTVAPDDQTVEAGQVARPPEDLPLSLPAEDRRRIDEIAARIERECDETDDATLRLRVLAERFDLSRRHLDGFLLALAPRLDETYAEQYERVQGDSFLSRLTVVLLEALFATTPEERLAAGSLVASDSPLRRHDLLRVESAPDSYPSERGRQFVVPDRIVEFLRGADGVDPALRAAVGDDAGAGTGKPAIELRSVDADFEDLVVSDDRRERLEAARASGDGSLRCYLHGPDASELGRAAEALCDDERYLEADLGAVLDAGTLDRLRREIALLDRPLHLRNVTDAIEVRDATLDAAFEQFANLDLDVVASGAEPWRPAAPLSRPIDAVVELPRLSIGQRRECWERHADELPEDLDPAVLAGTFELTAGELEAALATARSLAASGEQTRDDILEGCRAQSADDLEELARRIEPSSTWDDIELDADTERKLRIVLDHVKHQARIYGEWGFAEQFSRGTGVVAMFEGPSGTGKTMAAEVLANEVGMAVYKIDLSTVVSKYIGETEENLERIFRAAEHSNAILLFDEADAVFGDRAQVSDATDRYANVEVNYLLQRIETYDGVVLLTTNYPENVDDAFDRRIDHTVSFSRPESDTRRAIWNGIVPDAVPIEDLDDDFLAQFDLTGGSIRTVCQTAAILAAGSDADAIGMSHFVRSLQLVFERRGTFLDPDDFEQYRTHLDCDGADERATNVEVDADASEAATPESSPESIVREYVDHLDAGRGDDATALFHSRAVTDEPSYKERAAFERGDVRIVGDVERVRERADRVVVQFTWTVQGSKADLTCELRREEGSWRIFDLGRDRASTIDLRE